MKEGTMVSVSEAAIALKHQQLCKAGVAWLENVGDNCAGQKSDLTLNEVWQVCPRGDWMVYILYHEDLIDSTRSYQLCELWQTRESRLAERALTDPGLYVSLKLDADRVREEFPTLPEEIIFGIQDVLQKIREERK